MTTTPDHNAAGQRPTEADKEEVEPQAPLTTNAAAIAITATTDAYTLIFMETRAPVSRCSSFGCVKLLHLA